MVELRAIAAPRRKARQFDACNESWKRADFYPIFGACEQCALKSLLEAIESHRETRDPVLDTLVRSKTCKLYAALRWQRKVNGNTQLSADVMM